MKKTQKEKLLQVVFIVVFVVLSALIVSLVAHWVVSLDKILTAGLFATLAGLALAGGAFLQAPLGEQRRLSEDLKEKELSSRPKDFGDLKEAENWFKAVISPADTKSCDCSINEAKECIGKGDKFNPETQMYLLNRVNAYEAHKYLNHLQSIQKNFVVSFNYLALGIIEGVTLDVVASTNEEMSKNSSWFLELWQATPITPVLATLDIAFSVTLLSLGLYALYKAGAGLNNRFDER